MQTYEDKYYIHTQRKRGREGGLKSRFKILEGNNRTGNNRN
jgi:hypothetical protein